MANLKARIALQTATSHSLAAATRHSEQPSDTLARRMRLVRAILAATISNQPRPTTSR